MLWLRGKKKTIINYAYVASGLQIKLCQVTKRLLQQRMVNLTELCCSKKWSSDSSNFAVIVLQQKINVQVSSNIAVSSIIAASSRNCCQQ